MSGSAPVLSNFSARGTTRRAQRRQNSTLSFWDSRRPISREDMVAMWSNFSHLMHIYSTNNYYCMHEWCTCVFLAWNSHYYTWFNTYMACVTYFMHVRTGFRNSRLRHLDRFAGVYNYGIVLIKLPFFQALIVLSICKTTIVVRLSDSPKTTCSQLACWHCSNFTWSPAWP